MPGSIEGGDLRRELLAHAEVPGAKGHLFAEFDEPLGSTGDRALLRVRGGSLVKLDAAREVEAALDRRANERLELDQRHRSRR
jgi:hypothetical protein